MVFLELKFPFSPCFLGETLLTQPTKKGCRSFLPMNISTGESEDKLWRKIAAWIRSVFWGRFVGFQRLRGAFFGEFGTPVSQKDSKAFSHFLADSFPRKAARHKGLFSPGSGPNVR